jgi:hypothetical protein
MQVKKEIFEGQTSTNEVFSNQGQHECHTATGLGLVLTTSMNRQHPIVPIMISP